MKNPFESFYYDFEILTPVHIGGAKENDYLLGADFYYDTGTYEIVFFQQTKSLKKLSSKKLVEYTSFITKNKMAEASEIIRSVCNNNPELIVQRTYFPFVVQNDIRRHYSTALGKLVIPGSSIKGAIRSVIGKYIIQETNNRPRESRDFDAIFGTISNNLMHFLQVSDVEFDRTSSITPFKTFSGDIKNSIRETNYGLEYEGKGMWKFQSGQGERTHDSDFSEDGFVFLYETCSTGTKGKLRLNWAKGLDEITPSNKKPNNYRYYDAVFGNNWMGLAKLQMEKYLEQEIYFFKKFPNENFPNAIELLEEIQAMNNEPDTVMLRLGMGSGYHAITGNWRFHDHTQTGQAERRNRDTRQFEKINAIKYKTRKISFIDNSTEEDSSLWLDLPGFVKIMVQP